MYADMGIGATVSDGLGGSGPIGSDDGAIGGWADGASDLRIVGDG